MKFGRLFGSKSGLTKVTLTLIAWLTEPTPITMIYASFALSKVVLRTGFWSLELTLLSFLFKKLHTNLFNLIIRFLTSNIDLNITLNSTFHKFSCFYSVFHSICSTYFSPNLHLRRVILTSNLTSLKISLNFCHRNSLNLECKYFRGQHSIYFSLLI